MIGKSFVTPNAIHRYPEHLRIVTLENGVEFVVLGNVKLGAGVPVGRGASAPFGVLGLGGFVSSKVFPLIVRSWLK